MPFYDHKCNKCKKTSEHFYSVTKDPKTIQCPHCNSEDTERLLGKPHLGWERRVYKCLMKGDEERYTAEQTSHMGSNPYEAMPDEINR